jgi:hypothetical protein
MVRDEYTVPQPGLDVVLTLQDGRQLDGWLIRHEHVWRCEHVLFEAWQVDEVFPQPG